MEFIKEKDISNRKFLLKCGLSGTYISTLTGNPSGDTLKKIEAAYPDLNTDWLLTGEGEMLKEENSPAQEVSPYTTMLLPISALAGALTGFDASVTAHQCERIASPMADIDFAIEVYGDSMIPRYPSGSRLFVKKIDTEAFIEWGKTYLISTTNGSIVKVVMPTEDVNMIECKSLNEMYPPFRVAKKDIYAMYRVRAMMLIE